tara:strand:+ start:7810 stop:8067 length:258 start_codon:yes stop_codon:yes gene_type:complete
MALSFARGIGRWNQKMVDELVHPWRPDPVRGQGQTARLQLQSPSIVLVSGPNGLNAPKIVVVAISIAAGLLGCNQRMVERFAQTP